jgi:hypothetical protein
MNRTSHLVILVRIGAVLSLISLGLDGQVNARSSLALSGIQGFLSQEIRDLLALLGAILAVEKIVRMLISSAHSGRIRNLYVRYILPQLMSWTYDKGDVTRINENLYQLSIGKLTSKNQEERETGLKQLASVKPNVHTFKILLRALAREHSKHLRVEIVRALSLQAKYDSK